ncbi:hypothetical protein ACFLQU_04140 [Verrucomicrobiota bacterium]
MSKFAPKRSNLNMPGAWNAAIVTPNWLKQQFPDLVPGDKFEAQLLSGPAPSFQFVIHGVTVAPWNGKLILSPVDDQEGILDYVQKLGLAIFKRLPHTPIAAVGHNFVYELEGDEGFAVERFMDNAGRDEFYSSLDLGMSCEKKQHTFAYDDHLLNVIYDTSEEQPYLQINCHYAVSDSRKIENAISQFTANQSKAECLVTGLVRR